MLTCSCLDLFFKGMRQFLSTMLLQFVLDSTEPRLDELKLHSSVSICTFVLASKYFCSSKATCNAACCCLAVSVVPVTPASYSSCSAAASCVSAYLRPLETPCS